VTQSGQQLEVRALAVTLDRLICSWLIDLPGQSLSAKTVSTYGGAALRLAAGLPGSGLPRVAAVLHMG
jgi:hypothetical protein